MTKRPNSRVNLDKAIMRLFGSYDKSLETRDIIANAIVGQMLCGAVVKGGSGLKLRYGMSCTRATVDLDTACSGDIPQFIELIVERTPIDLAETRRICERLFAFRRLQTWPPRIVMRQEWEPLYRTANAKGAANRSLAEAIEWANGLIAQITSSGEQQTPSAQ